MNQYELVVASLLFASVMLGFAFVALHQLRKFEASIQVYLEKGAAFFLSIAILMMFTAIIFGIARLLL